MTADQERSTADDVTEPQRKYPLQKPVGHKPPVPRWTLQFPTGVEQVHTIYVGVQQHRHRHRDDPSGPSTGNDDSGVAAQAESQIHTILVPRSGGAPAGIDVFRVTHGYDQPGAKVWVAYYTCRKDYLAALARLDLAKIWRSLDSKSIGLWKEHFSAPVTRLETNYSRLEHRPGLAQIAGTIQPSHELSAYWGAGRDRIPASATDQFPAPHDIKRHITDGGAPHQDGYDKRLTAINYDNMCHIRSGQYWQTCDEAERRAYEDTLEPTLMQGMQYLWDHPDETGTLGLRFLQNLHPGYYDSIEANEERKGEEELIRETCAAGFHNNWAGLERWSARHPSHLAIFNGALRHAKTFGENRKFMTWHEVWILKAGEAHMEYVNCAPGTGVARGLKMRIENL